MTPHELKKFIYGHPRAVRNLMLTDNQCIIIRLVKDRGSVTSSWFSKYQKISVQNASMQLIKLYKKGYLTKEQVTSKTGGLENIFRSVV